MAARPKLKLCSTSTPTTAASEAESHIFREYLDNKIKIFYIRVLMGYIKVYIRDYFCDEM